MAKNQIVKILVDGDVWVCPAGVTNVNIVTAKLPQLPVINNGSSSYGITTTGQLYTWGNNGFGVLGVGDAINRSSPVLVLGGLTFKSAVISNSSSYGITTAGQLYAWGNNANGVLGVGDIVNRSSPVAVLGGLTFKSAVIYSNGSSYGITTAGQLYAWGGNASGRLGVGDLVARSSPVAVLGGLTSTINNSTTEQVLSVTPGQSYTVDLSGYSFFGTEPINTESLDLIYIEYFT